MKPTYDDGLVTVYEGDALDCLRAMESGSVDCVVTSPPYWGLRDYGVEGQLGLEATPEDFIESMDPAIASRPSGHESTAHAPSDTAPAKDRHAGRPETADRGC